MILSLLCVAAAAGLAAVHLPAGIVMPAAVVLPYMWYFVTAGYGSGTSAATVGPADGIVWDFVATSTTTTALRALFGPPSRSCSSAHYDDRVSGTSPGGHSAQLPHW